MEYIRDFGITGPIYRSPSCSGSETRLEYCPFTNFGSYINQYHSNDVTIRCHPTSNPGIENRCKILHSSVTLVNTAQ